MPKVLDNALTKADIVELLRTQIVRGDFASGDRLPTRSELERQFSTTKMTLQRAFDTLAEEGFISAEGTRGTFVSQHPPHTSRYALAFHNPQETRTHFWTMLCDEAAGLEKKLGCRIRPYYDVNEHQYSDDYKLLCHHVKTHQVAGVIFASNPSSLKHTSLMQMRDTPMVTIMTDTSEFDFTMPVVKIDYGSFFSQALDAVKSSGRRRVAAINPVMLTVTQGEHFAREVTQRGLVTRPTWWLPVELTSPIAASAYVQLLMDRPDAERPDALIISDDNLVEPVLAGLQNAGICIPQDLEIVAHSNFPPPAPAPVPMRRLGYPAREVFNACMDLIASQRGGKATSSLTAIKAVFEDEIASGSLQVQN